jgi:hypothetical protein
MLSQANQRKSWYSKSNNNRAVEIILAYQHNFIYNFFCNLYLWIVYQKNNPVFHFFLVKPGPMKLINLQVTENAFRAQIGRQNIHF